MAPKKPPIGMLPSDEMLAIYRGKKRWPVTAVDRAEAVRIAKQKPWWGRVINKVMPFPEHKKWWFVLEDEV